VASGIGSAGFVSAVWVIALAFRLVGICVGAIFALLKSILFLPARLLGYRG
jgi:hypothetical protein